MNRLQTIAASAALVSTMLLTAACAATAPRAAEEPVGLSDTESVLPFVSHRSIHNWHANGQDGVWVQDARKQWYYARLSSPCMGLDFATRIAFIPVGNTLDRFGKVLVPEYPDQPCLIDSFKASGPPPEKKKK